MQLDFVVRIKIVGPQRHPLFGRTARQVILGQVRPIDRRRRILAQHNNATVIAAPPQHLGRRKAGRAAANDHDAARSIRDGCAPRVRLREFLAHEDAPVAPLDLPAIDRTQGRRAECLAAAQIEAGMVPRAAHRAVNNEAVGERPMIVGAMRADREDVRAAQDQQHLVVADMSERGVQRSGRPTRRLGSDRGRSEQIVQPLSPAFIVGSHENYAAIPGLSPDERDPASWSTPRWDRTAKGLGEKRRLPIGLLFEAPIPQKFS